MSQPSQPVCSVDTAVLSSVLGVQSTVAVSAGLQCTAVLSSVLGVQSTVAVSAGLQCRYCCT